MTATDELRRLLDERGVEWEDDSPVLSMKPWKTSFTSFTGEEVTLGCYDEPKWIMGTLVFHTPAQAIEATLGRGECRIDLVSYTQTKDTYQCRSCDKSWTVQRGRLPGYNFCPNCGRKVVDA